MTDRLEVMRTLVAVGRSRSFSAAAARLGISTSLASRQVSRLEKDLGTQLVERTRPQLTLTEDGKKYVEFASRILGDITRQDAALASMRDRAEGRLNAVAPKWIGAAELGEAVADFSVEHPRIAVRFDIGVPAEQGYDFIEDGFDVAFRTKALRDSALKAKKLASLAFVICASPGYIADAGAPQLPRELPKHRCLLHVNEPVWHLEHDGKVEHIKISHPVFQSNTYLALHQGALLGLGIAVLPWRTVYEDVAAGRLQVLLPDQKVPDRPLFAIYPPGESPARKVRVFLDFLQKWLSDHPVPTAAATSR